MACHYPSRRHRENNGLAPRVYSERPTLEAAGKNFLQEILAQTPRLPFPRPQITSTPRMDSQKDADRRRELMQRDWAAEVTRLMTRVVELQAEVWDLGAQNEQLREERARQRDEIEAIRAQLGQSEAQPERPAEETAPRKGPVQRRERFFAFPEGQRIIAQDRTMMQDDTVTVVEIPDSVTKIDKNAFRNWRALERVSMSSGSSLEFIGIGAFQDSGIR